MLAPKGPTFNGRPTFTNLMYLKMAQSEKPCLYVIQYDQCDPANRLVPDREETPTLEKESRSKLNKDLVRPYDYTKLNKLVDQAWEKHSHDHFRAPTAHDMEILIKTCLMPLAIKTQNDSFTFVHEIKLLLIIFHKVNECECLAQKLSKQTKSVSKEVYTKLLRSFAKLEKHSISLELALQQCQEQMKNDTVCKEKASNVFLKEREQYFEIQDLKAQLQDKNIAISELKKLIEKMKVRKSSFAKRYDVNAHGLSRNSPKHVLFQSQRESVGSNDMVHNYYLEEAKKKAQLQKDKALNTKPSVQQSARLPNTTNGNKPKPRNFNQQPRNWPPSMSSRVTNRTVNIAEPPRNQITFLKSKDLACPTCKKCIYSANHDECILKYISKVHSRASTPKKDAQSHKTTKRYMPVEKKCDSKKHDRQIPIGQKFSLNKSSAVYLKTTPPRSGLTWKPTGRIFTQVGLKWIPIRKPVESRYNMNDSASPLGKETHNPKNVICANSSSLSAGTSMASEPISSKGHLM
ncbi:hypothetical protein Tco_0173681 [Tanacetum coccineum]